MNTTLYTLLLACSVFLSSCCRAKQSPEALAPEKKPPQMIQIRNLTLTDGTLTLDYRVLNPFEDDIWACYDLWVHGERDVQNTATRIDGETVRIKLRFNRESVGGAVFRDPLAIAKYVRLSPGESCSGRILRNLPIKDYVSEWGAEHTEHKAVVLHRAVFEIGYIAKFGPEWDEIIASWADKFEKEGIKPKPKVGGWIYYLPVNPLITEETLDGQLRKVMYLEEYTSLVEKEEYAEVAVTDVAIPCSVVVDEE